MSLSLGHRRSVLALGRRMATRRFESTTTAQTAQKVAETAKDSAAKASEYAGKAAQGLSRVSSAAGVAVTGMVGRVGRMGGQVGKVASFVERTTPVVIYWSRVGIELATLVFKGQKMSPPPMSVFQNYFQNLWKQASNPSVLFRNVSNASSGSSSSVVQRLRNISTPQIVAGGVVAAECLGFFTAGEMLGRLKIVGYHGESGAHH